MAPLHKRNEANHPHLCESIVNAINLITNVGYTVGGFLFLEEASELWEAERYAGISAAEVGDYIFIVGSVIGTILTIRSLVVSIKGVPKEGPSDLPLHNDVKMNEIFTSLIFVVSNVIFFLGSLFFFPRIIPLFTTEEKVKQACEVIGAWLFVSGSFGFVFGSFYGAVSLGAYMQKNVRKEEEQHEHIHFANRIYQARKWATLCSLTGGVLFVVGSFLYRPGFSKTCNNDVVDMTEESLVLCANTAEFGTWCYIIGGFLFVIDSFLEILVSMMERRKEAAEEVGRELGDESEEE